MHDVIQSSLPGGTPLLIEPISGMRSVGLTWLLPAGSASDPPHLEGISAMWAELIQRGAGTRDSREHADALDRLGVSRSVSAGTRYLRLQATMPGERLPEAVPLIADMVLGPRFDPDAIEPTRDLALQALESLRDDPQERAILAARARHRPAPFNRSGLGTPEGLGAVTRDDLIDGWRDSARPEGSVIAVAGAVRPDVAEAELAAALGGWSGAAAVPEESDAPTRGYAHELDESNQVQIVVAQDGPSEPDDDSVLERVVSSVLSGGMSGRLFTEVRERRGLCYAVHSSYRADHDRGVVTSYVGTTPERAQESLDVLWSELDRLSGEEGRITEDEFGRAIIGMKSRLVFSGESTAARASALASDFTKIGRARSLAEITAQIDAVSLESVNDYASRRRPGTPTIQTLGPAPLTPP